MGHSLPWVMQDLYHQPYNPKSSTRQAGESRVALRAEGAPARERQKCFGRLGFRGLGFRGLGV